MSELHVSPELFQNQPCLRLHHACGDTVLVALHGAHILSWTSGGEERLYLSPQAIFDGHTALRGGVPLCFPQFNMRGSLPKHGFARTSAWTPVPADEGLELQLRTSPATLAIWPHAFTATLRVEIAPGTLQVSFTVDNTGPEPLDFALALHTYLRVHDLPTLQLQGLAAQPYWDDVAQTNRLEPGRVTFDGEVDRVYQAAPEPLTLVDGEVQLRIVQSDTLADTVVWNPGATKCAAMADMPDAGYQQMVCVEAAQVNTPITLAAGAQWTGWQRISVL
ncbi:D-hexose-6-phosphate mutarotase [Rhodoferax sp.]|uniref:D-hexose-6-phosphate mutarotase n=1 Tax=Rhodoferax sp. TaxID=50421 RepID=UPI0025F2FDCE|nr:D-hexose-6-phosphate mutarotase [Rhodoferax sp.]